jgi:hypothetical protein
MQDPIFSRAKRGDLPSALSIPDICRLSTASLSCPIGRYSPGDDLAMRLRQLVALGLVEPERSEEVSTPGTVLASFGGSPITTSASKYTEHFVTTASLRAVLVDLGEIGPLLASWIDSGVAAASVQVGEPWHRARVRDFCATIMRAETIDPDKPPFTAMDVAQAMKQLGLWHRHSKPLPDDETLRRYAAKPDAAGWFFYFPEGNPATHDLPAELRVERLVRAYLAGQKPDNETGSIRLPVSNFRATGRR